MAFSSSTGHLTSASGKSCFWQSSTTSRRLDQPRINLQPVDEPKRGKTRIHLDLAVDDLDGVIERIVALGGRGPIERHDYRVGTVVVREDPEGNESASRATRIR